MKTLLKTLVITGLAGTSLSVRAASPAPVTRTIECSQNADGVRYVKVVNDNGKTSLTVDTLNLRLADLGLPGSERAAHARFEFAAEPRSRVMFGQGDPYLASIWGAVDRLVFLSYDNTELAHIDRPDLNLHLSSFHGNSLELYESSNSVGFEVALWSQKLKRSIDGHFWFPHVEPNGPFTCSVQ